MRGLALPVLTLCLMVQAHGAAFADTPDAPVYSEGAPIKPGDITIEQVIEAHKGLPEATIQQPLTPPQPATAPVLAPNQNQSTVGVMLMQGMESVLQEPGKSGTPKLKPPQMQDTTAAAPPAPVLPILTPPSLIAPAPAPAAPSGVTYQAGQEPKNLATSAASLPATEPAAETSETISTSPIVASGSTPGCAPHTDAWIRKCADAGYPDEFVGEIKGETRTTCPAGALQDVWISNTCAPPEEGAAATENAAPAAASAATSQPEAAIFSSTASRDANCGDANGLAAATAPTSGLCAAGEATQVSGTGPWLWSCRGANGGTTVSCAAPFGASAAAAATNAGPLPAHPAEDGQCGASDGLSAVQAPLDNLCAKGMPSHVSGEGPWTWACSGINGGTAAACNAPKKTDGVCGSANNLGTNSMPISDLCTEGYASAVTGEGPWNWTCSGLNGGGAVTCTASAKRDAVCGLASFTGHKDVPKDNLCSVGTPSIVSGNGPWLWTCDGLGGAASVSCTADVSVSGACGSANGVAVSSVPSADDLCARGKPTRVSGDGPWAWNCVGLEGGDTESCTAPRGGTAAEPVAAAITSAVPASTSAPATSASSAAPATGLVSGSASVTRHETTLCGTAVELAAFETPTSNLCRAGTASNMAGSGPWTWTCSDQAGHSANCSTLAPGSFNTAEAAAAAPETTATVAAASASKAAVCGAAAGQGTEEKPTDDLCAAGNASSVKGKGPWTWTCIKHRQKVACEAPKLIDAVCGNANGTTRKVAPSVDLCKVGNPTAIQGNGPWLWSCVGSAGGISVSCAAASQVLARIDGACGTASGTPTASAPMLNLCDSGNPSRVYGEGPWTWTCSGLNGGIASSCSTQKNVPSAPPPPGPFVNGLCGASNGAALLAQPSEGLCDAGTATAVSGNGPWNWNCLGTNGGMTVSCTALLQPPAPITGVCGAATGVPTLSKPEGGLCAAGITSAVSGRGPWTWSCSGTNGGGAVACIAPLAGSGGGPLPSLVTPSEAPAPVASPSSAVTHTGLVTPHLAPSPSPLGKEGIPAIPASAFPAAPTPSAVPIPPTFQNGEALPSDTMPNLPPEAEALTPPPVRDTIATSTALKTPALDAGVAPLAGTGFSLDEDISSIGFARGAENIDPSTLPSLDKLASVLVSNTGVRITLTAYADASNTSPREARRLSLTRALAIRDYLTAKGVASSRIDVRALGANVPSGDADRVDVKAE